MFKKSLKITVAVIILILAFFAGHDNVGAQEPEDYDWVCYGGTVITCDKTGDDQANVYMQWPEGYCIGLTVPDYIGDGVQYYAYYMVPCTEQTPPEMSAEVQKWATEAIEGDIYTNWKGTWTMGSSGYTILDEGDGKQSLWHNNQKIGFSDPAINGGKWQGVVPG